ncbi:c-type cytochrome [Pelagibius sp. CAU 1746]|uniref:c-type cytochrome n=1 Tax=Pelagibius sp. CAU 1746 TaxID=3140370 RepID=UPI00325BEDF9
MHSVLVRFAAPALTAAAALTAGTAGAEEKRGAVLANTCFSCHGTDGHSAGAMPSIAGKSADYIVETLKRFRSGDKASTVMVRIAKGFTDDEIVALADYFSAGN